MSADGEFNLVVKGKQFHLVGIAGVGMSALAQALVDAGAVVSGSDRLFDNGDPCESVQALLRQGVKVYSQNGAALCGDESGLVVSTAIEPDNPEVIRAAEFMIPRFHRSEMIAALTAGREMIAVSGTSGKTTVTAILGHILACAGYDPTVINGAPVIDWISDSRCGSVRKGVSSLWVVEADESDRSLLNLNPTHAIITNASSDHFSLKDTKALFSTFREGINGHVIDGASDDWEAPECSITERGCSFSRHGVVFELPMPGIHNAMNAAQAIDMCVAMGIDPTSLVSGIASFGGVSRRLERVGQCGNAVVYDDMAHNPSKLRAAWSTLSAIHPSIVGVWRPHGFRPLRSMFSELAEMFSEVVRHVDKLFILPVYDAGGTADRSVSSDQLIDALRKRGTEVEQVDSMALVERRFSELSYSFSAIVTLGARDPELPRLAKRLALKSNGPV